MLFCIHILKVRWTGIAAIVFGTLSIIASSVIAEERQFASAVRASLVFREEFNAKDVYSHSLQVYIRLENIYDGEVTWVADSFTGIQANLLDDDGKEVPQPPWAGNVASKPNARSLPYGSRLDWLISHKGWSMATDETNRIALEVGSASWLLPKDKLSTYKLRVSLYGVPWSRDETSNKIEHLLDIPATKIDFTEMKAVYRSHERSEKKDLQGMIPDPEHESPKPQDCKRPNHGSTYGCADKLE